VRVHLAGGVLVDAVMFKLVFVGFIVRSIRKHCVIYFCGDRSPSALNFAWFITAGYYVGKIRKLTDMCLCLHS